MPPVPRPALRPCSPCSHPSVRHPGRRLALLALGSTLLAGPALAQQNLIILPATDEPEPAAPPPAPSLAPAPAPAAAPTGPRSQRALNNQLELRVRSMRFAQGDRQGALVIAMPVINIGPNTVYLQMAGPTTAVDYDTRQFTQIDHERITGISLAHRYGSGRDAIGFLHGNDNMAEDGLRRFVRLNPGGQMVMTFRLLGPRQVGRQVDLSLVLLARVVRDPERDLQMSWLQRAHTVQTVEMTFMEEPVQVEPGT